MAMNFPATINDLYDQLSSTGALLQHQFQLTFAGIPIQEVAKGLEGITMWAESASIPGRKQNHSPIQYLGYAFACATNMEMTTEMSFTLNLSKDLKIHDALLLWQSYITNADIEGGSAGGGVKRASRAFAVLDLMDEQMKAIVHSYKLMGIFPSDVGDIKMSNSDPKVATCEVKFKWQYWRYTKSPNVVI